MRDEMEPELQQDVEEPVAVEIPKSSISYVAFYRNIRYPTGVWSNSDRRDVYFDHGYDPTLVPREELGTRPEDTEGRMEREREEQMGNGVENNRRGERGEGPENREQNQGEQVGHQNVGDGEANNIPVNNADQNVDVPFNNREQNNGAAAENPVQGEGANGPNDAGAGRMIHGEQGQPRVVDRDEDEVVVVPVEPRHVEIVTIDSNDEGGQGEVPANARRRSRGRPRKRRRILVFSPEGRSADPPHYDAMYRVSNEGKLFTGLANLIRDSRPVGSPGISGNARIVVTRRSR